MQQDFSTLSLGVFGAGTFLCGRCLVHCMRYDSILDFHPQCASKSLSPFLSLSPFQTYSLEQYHHVLKAFSIVLEVSAQEIEWWGTLGKHSRQPWSSKTPFCLVLHTNTRLGQSTEINPVEPFYPVTWILVTWASALWGLTAKGLLLPGMWMWTPQEDLVAST